MGDQLRTILIVDDTKLNRSILCRILDGDYITVEAENGQVALDILKEHPGEFSAVLLDLVMPVMDGYTFLSELKSTADFGIPVIVTTGNSATENERKAFNLGAWDFVSKPYDPQILKYRLNSAIARSEGAAFEKMKYMSEHDALTGLYNRSKFFEETQALLHAWPEEQFAFVRLDVDRFSLINTFFGISEGDRLLRYIATHLEQFCSMVEHYTYGRIEADEFAICCSYSSLDALNEAMEKSSSDFKQYPLEFEIILTFGVYIITDRKLSVQQMLDNANLAAKQVKGHYSNTVAFYDEKIGQQLIAEQAIINDMIQALEQKQFCVYMQPKYDLHTNLPAGAEALVRWNHPERGMIFPGEFIPIFEKNGFIAKLDYYIWEAVCCQLEEWLDKGMTCFPVSVNVSRVHLYNPQLTDILCDMADKHHVPHELLNLELTESIYTENPTVIQDSISKLHSKGFVVMMDDFGSGYSSLNVLKDVEFDVLKIDMKFFDHSAIKGRGEDIIASIIRMAKWLGLPTIAEGVEKEEQVAFLRDMGCEYVQGYFFAKPMPVQQYEELISAIEPVITEKNQTLSMNELWNDNAQIENLFTTVSQPIVLYEFADDKLELIRVNKAFYDMFGYNDRAVNARNPERVLADGYYNIVWAAFHDTVSSKESGRCDYMRKCADGRQRWIHLDLKYVNQIGQRHIILGTLWDVTARKTINEELAQYKTSHFQDTSRREKMLIVDDLEINREILEEMFVSRFDVIFADNGQSALEMLEKEQYEVDIILLDLIMPVMDGVTFLEHKNANPLMRDIPVVIITADNAPSRQINMLALGANDYVTKPFVNEVAIKRVNNVLESSVRFREIVKEYNQVLELSKIDGLTGVYNRTATEALSNHLLNVRPDISYGFMMLDVDDFKNINDTYGHIIGDEVLKGVANRLQRFFRTGDIIGRLGGDEFVVFMSGMNSEELLQRKATELRNLIKESALTDLHLKVEVSIGVCMSRRGSSFMELYSEADKVLYETKDIQKMREKSCQSE